MDNNYLSHHGILGMKWGKKNGPPYPLDFSKLSSKERELAKKESIDKGDVKTAYANRSYYTNQEITDLINRFDMEARLGQKVSDLSKQEIAAGKKNINKFIDTLTTVETISGKVGNISQSFVKIRGALGNNNNNAKTTDNVTKAIDKLSKNIEKNMEKNDKSRKKDEKKAKQDAKEAKKQERLNKSVDKSIDKIINKIEKENSWKQEQKKSDEEFWKSKQVEHVSGDVVNSDGSPIYDWNTNSSAVQFLLEDKWR